MLLISLKYCWHCVGFKLFPLLYYKLSCHEGIPFKAILAKMVAAKIRVHCRSTPACPRPSHLFSPTLLESRIPRKTKQANIFSVSIRASRSNAALYHRSKHWKKRYIRERKPRFYTRLQVPAEQRSPCDVTSRLRPVPEELTGCN